MDRQAVRNGPKGRRIIVLCLRRTYPSFGLAPTIGSLALTRITTGFFSMKVAVILAAMRLLALTALTANSPAIAEETLFVAEPFTKEGNFTAGIEGPACDGKGIV